MHLAELPLLPWAARRCFSSVELAVLSACFPSSCFSLAHHGFWPGVLKRASPSREWRCATSARAPVHHPKRPAPFTNRVLVRPVLSLAKSPPSSLLKLDLSLDVCSSAAVLLTLHARRVVLPRLYLGAELLPLLLENMAFRLDLNLVQIQVLVQELTFCCPSSQLSC